MMKTIPSTSPFHYSKAKRPVGIWQSQASPVANTGAESRSPPLGSLSWVRRGWSLTVIIQKSRWEKKSVLRCPGNVPRRSAKMAAARSHTPLGFLCVCTHVHHAEPNRFSAHHHVKGGRAPKAPNDTAIIRPKAAQLHFTSPEHD